MRYLFVLSTLWIPVFLQAGENSTAKPNIVLIMVDDMGYGDAGCYGSKTIATPNLDALARNGVRFTDFYSSGAWCVPSRKGLMTGVHPYRGGLNNPRALAERVTIAEMLKQNGYATALLGKWHLGLGDGLHPLEQGFDYFYGTAGSNDVPAPKGKRQVYEVFRTSTEADWPVPLFRNHDVIEKPAKQSLFTKRYTAEAVQFIEDHRASPFFLYVAHNMPHVPIFASKDFRGKSKGGLYGDVIEELDWSVGQIVEKLAATGLSEKTLVIFTSDNGPWSMFPEFAGTAEPLRGEKGTGWEGGSGVPAIFSWPGKINPRTSDAFAVNLDIYATVAKITGSQLPEYETDSFDLSGVLFHAEPSPRRDYLFFSGGRWKSPFSYRSGRHKIHVRTNEKIRDPHTAASAPVTTHDPPLLFDLHADRSESKNIAAESPDLVRRLKSEFDAVAREIMQ